VTARFLVFAVLVVSHAIAVVAAVQQEHAVGFVATIAVVFFARVLGDWDEWRIWDD
jgi:hypothetical protein